AQRAEPGERPAAAQELDALPALESFPRADRDDADGAGLRDVRAAARRQIESLDVDHPKRALTLRLFPKLKIRGFVRIDELDVDGTILPDDAVGLGLGGGDVSRPQLPREVDRRDVGAEMETDRANAEHAIEG